MLKKILILSFIMSFISCPGHNSASIFLHNKKEKIYKTSTCQIEKNFPQMVVLPFFKRAAQIVPDCKTYPKHQTALAMMVFYHHWIDWFEDDDLVVKNALENLVVEWSKEKKIIKKGYSIDGELRKNITVTGITKTKSYIWVWEGYYHKISESSLIHELVHVALRAKNGHGDSDHEGPKYNGWTINHSAMILEAKETLRAFNI